MNSRKGILITTSIGLVIQGPIFSPGYGPYGFNQDGNYVKSWIEYDATTDIIETVGEASILFNHIVVSTWKSEYAGELVARLQSNPKVTVLFNSEDSFLVGKRQTGTHKYHQVYSLLTGIRVLGKFGCKVVVKSRSDQRLDMSKLFKAATRHSKKNPASLGVPYMNLFEIDRLADFYWVGETETMERLCSTYLKTPEIYIDGHKDYFYKFSKDFFHNSASSESVGNQTRGNRKLPENYLLWTSAFYPLRKSIFKGSKWRGRKVNSTLNNWIRWHNLIYCSNSNLTVFGTIGNILIIKLVKAIKRPFIPLFGAVQYRIFRRISMRKARNSF